MTDPIADMLTRIKNAQIMGKSFVTFPYSKVKWNISETLLKKELIASLDKLGRQIKKTIKIGIKYNENKSSYITHLERVSKLSNRQYVQYKDIYAPHGNNSFMVISTSKGIMTGREAKKKKLGGEILLKIW